MKILTLLLLLPALAFAKPVAIAESDGIVITLTDERCAVAEVTNLPYRATWLENGKTVEGCWGVAHQIVMSYWTDKTVAILPAGAFNKALEI